MGARLKDEDIADVKECFTMFDRDNDGKISCQELGTVVRSLGENPTEAELEEIVRVSSVRANSFDLRQLLDVVTHLQNRHKDKEEEIREAFRVFDRDGHGYVNAAELRHIMTNIGEKLSDGEMDEMIRELDVDGQGQVNYEEVVMMMIGK